MKVSEQKIILDKRIKEREMKLKSEAQAGAASSAIPLSAIPVLSAETAQKELERSIELRDINSGHISTHHRRIMYKILAGQSVVAIAKEMKIGEDVLMEIMQSPLFRVEFLTLKKTISKHVVVIKHAAEALAPEMLMTVVNTARHAGAEKLRFEAALAMLKISGDYDQKKNVEIDITMDFGKRIQEVWRKRENRSAIEAHSRLIENRE